MLGLPDVAQLVADEVVGGLGEGPAQEDERPGLVAVEAAEPRQGEEARRVEDADAPDVDGLGVEREAVEARLGPHDRGALGGRAWGQQSSRHREREPSAGFAARRDAVGTTHGTRERIRTSRRGGGGARGRGHRRRARGATRAATRTYIPPGESDDPARRVVEEAGGGESEGFELAEAELIDRAENSSGPSPAVDAERVSEDDRADIVYGEADSFETSEDDPDADEDG